MMGLKRYITNKTSDKHSKMLITAPCSNLSKIRGVSFQWDHNEDPDKKFPEGKQFGVIAQEIVKVYPEMAEKTNEYYSMQYSELIPVLIEAIKELKIEKDNEQNELKKENDDLKDELKILKEEIEKIKKGINEK